MRERPNILEGPGSTTYFCKVECMPSAAIMMSASMLSPCAKCNRAEEAVWTIPTQRWPRRTASIGRVAARAFNKSALCMPYRPFQPVELVVTIGPTTVPSAR